MRICPNEKFIEIFAQRFHFFEDPFYKFFALNLLFQDTSYSLALKYSSFLFRLFSFAFYNINFWFKISKICPKISHFSQISHSRGNTIPNGTLLITCYIKTKAHGGTPKRATSGGVHLGYLVPGQHSFKEASQRWRTVINTVCDMNQLRI